jgi:hypothetical protein
MCSVRNTVCQYVASEFRQTKRKYEELRKDRSAHEELVNLIRTLPEQDAADLFQRIRAGNNVEAILDHVRDGDLLLQLQLVPETRLKYELPYTREMPALLLGTGSPYLESKIYQGASTRTLSQEVQNPSRNKGKQRAPREEPASSMALDPYNKPFHAAIFVEPRLEAARPSEWTSVSKDDALMRQLLAAYFTQEYQLFPVFQKDYFLEDLANVKMAGHGTECCSSLLVNTILALACVSIT